MTPKEFEKFRFDVQIERFEGDLQDPFQYAIARSKFEQQKFLRILTEAQKVTPCIKVVQRRIPQWKRQYERAVKTEQRLRNTLALFTSSGNIQTASQVQVAI